MRQAHDFAHYKPQERAIHLYLAMQRALQHKRRLRRCEGCVIGYGICGTGKSATVFHLLLCVFLHSSSILEIRDGCNIFVEDGPSKNKLRSFWDIVPLELVVNMNLPYLATFVLNFLRQFHFIVCSDSNWD